MSYLWKFESENHLRRKFSFQVSIGLVLIKEFIKHYDVILIII